MFKLDSEAALLKAFRPKDRSSVEISADVKLPALVRHYLAWTHPAGGRVYLVFSAPQGVPTGIVFDSNGGAGPSMCDWCLRWTPTVRPFGAFAKIQLCDAERYASNT